MFRLRFMFIAVDFFSPMNKIEIIDTENSSKKNVQTRHKTQNHIENKIKKKKLVAI